MRSSWKKRKKAIPAMELSALIVVERSSQKSILDGDRSDGSRLSVLAGPEGAEGKSVKKVELELYVRVEKNWRNRSSKLHQLGYLELEEGK